MVIPHIVVIRNVAVISTISSVVIVVVVGSVGICTRVMVFVLLE